MPELSLSHWGLFNHEQASFSKLFQQELPFSTEGAAADSARPLSSNWPFPSNVKEGSERDDRRGVSLHAFIPNDGTDRTDVAPF
jgi:hypothetical protein